MPTIADQIETIRSIADRLEEIARELCGSNHRAIMDEVSVLRAIIRNQPRRLARRG